MRADDLLDVAIVGYGPVGALLANALGQGGLRVGVFERAEEIYALPRAVHLDADCMRVFQAVGLAEAIRPWTIPTRGMEFVNSRGERYFGTVERGSAPVLTRSGWHRGYMFTQPQIEVELRAGVERFPSVSVHLAHEVETLEQQPDSVSITLRDLRADATRRARSRYVIGCDGAASTTRRSIGGRLESLGYDHRWLVVDVKLLRHVDLPEMSQQICDPARPTTFVVSALDHRRWEFQLQPGEAAETMQRPETIRTLLARWLHPDDAEITRAAVYEFHGTLASPWRDRRVLLAGDAAHQMPPFQGQGMCAGIRDVANLGWKLRWILDGRASDALLASYELERSPHARAVVASSIQVGELIDRLAASEARGEPLEDAALEANATRRAGWMPGLRFEGGRAPAPGPVGELIDQPRVALHGEAARRLDDVIGSRMAVISAEDPKRLLGSESLDFLHRIDALLLGADEFADRDGWLDELIEHHRALVVRPDRYVFGVAKDAPELEALVGRFRRSLQ